VRRDQTKRPLAIPGAAVLYRDLFSTFLLGLSGEMQVKTYFSLHPDLADVLRELVFIHHFWRNKMGLLFFWKQVCRLTVVRRQSDAARRSGERPPLNAIDWPL
jgi:hypothetical protein